MCHITRNINAMDTITVHQSNRSLSTVASILTTGGGSGRQQSKMTFRLSPFRKVAKSARINLNRYWGILSQSSAMKPAVPPSSSSSTVVVDHSEEIEQNRINELLEAQAAQAVDDNDRNTEYENSPDFRSSTSRRFFFSSSSSSSSCVSTSSSISNFIIPFDDDEDDRMSQDSMIL